MADASGGFLLYNGCGERMRSGEPVLEETLSHPTINVEGLFGAVVGAIETGPGKCGIIVVRRFCAAVVNPCIITPACGSKLEDEI
jgi:hypothetical protein